CPVILEYKRSSNENVMNQGLFYLDWLMDHKAEFQLLALKHVDQEKVDSIDWSSPRLICVAADFTRYDAHAVQQIDRNIELIRYRQFGNEFLLLELVNTTSGKSASVKVGGASKIAKSKNKSKGPTVYGAEALITANPETRELFESLEGYAMSLGDDVQSKDLKLYIAFKRIRNFTTVEVYKEKLLLHVHLNPDKVELVDGFTR